MLHTQLTGEITRWVNQNERVKSTQTIIGTGHFMEAQPLGG